MKKKISYILILLVQVFSIFSTVKVKAAPPTKTMTHTIVQSSWSISKNEGPDYYDYDDGLWFGRLYRNNTTWESRKEYRRANNWTMYSDSKKSLDDNDYNFYYGHYENYYKNQGYSGVIIKNVYWIRNTEGPGPYTYDDINGNTYTRDYRRDFAVEFEYNAYRYTSNYSGSVTARTNPPTIRLSAPVTNSRHHNQDKIIMEGFVKDIDVGDINAIYYTIEETQHVEKNITLIEPVKITATGNDVYFKGYIQLDQLMIPGEYNLKIWAKDDKGADSSTIEIPIIIYNLLEDILNNLKRYTFKQDKLQFIAINSKVPVIKSNINDELISLIKKELLEKNILMYFIGNTESKSYINSSLLGN